MLAEESRSLIGRREGFIFQRLNPLEHQDWDGFLAASDISGFFHSSAWARVLVDAYAHDPCYFIVREPMGFDSDSRAKLPGSGEAAELLRRREVLNPGKLK